MFQNKIQKSRACATQCWMSLTLSSFIIVWLIHLGTPQQRVIQQLSKQRDSSDNNILVIHRFDYIDSNMATKTTTANDVLLYVPNLIGYSRVAFTIGALFLMIAAKDYWILAIALYLASFVGDLFGKSVWAFVKIETWFSPPYLLLSVLILFTAFWIFVFLQTDWWRVVWDK